MKGNEPVEKNSTPKPPPRPERRQPEHRHARGTHRRPQPERLGFPFLERKRGLPQIQNNLRQADMELHWALWNLAKPGTLFPEGGEDRGGRSLYFPMR